MRQWRTTSRPSSWMISLMRAALSAAGVFHELDMSAAYRSCPSTVRLNTSVSASETDHFSYVPAAMAFQDAETPLHTRAQRVSLRGMPCAELVQDAGELV